MERENLLSRYGTAAERVERAAESLRQGRGILLVDDENRENEGDLIFAATNMTVEQMALMIRRCSGIVCLCLTEERVRQLDLPPMSTVNTSRYGTAFTVSIEAAEGITTGVSAADRIRTIRTAVAPDARPESLARPGHVFPLAARTEGSVDLTKLAGLPPCAVLCELTNEDGTMARLPEVVAFACEHDFPIVSIDDIRRYRTEREAARTDL